MRKVLVTTDLSTNSKSAVLFALQIAAQEAIEPVFYHAFPLLRPTSWNDDKFDAYQKQERAKHLAKLENFVAGIYAQHNLKPEQLPFTCVAERGNTPHESIAVFAQGNDIDLICIATRGAGSVKQLLGTNTSALIKHSPVPVLAVPSGYKVKPIAQLLYASDLNNATAELALVEPLAQAWQAKLSLLHFHSPVEAFKNQEVLQALNQSFTTRNIAVHIETPDPVESLVQNIESAVKRLKPSILVMFTQRNRTFFERLFLSSKTAELSYTTKVPLLVFAK